jgi:peptidoglycan-N-acetylglucosamine deacetylase
LRVALTFDAEHPDRPAREGCSEQVVEILEREEVPATFFFQGRWAEAHPHLARRIADRHLVGSHSHYHARMPLLSSAGLRSDVQAAENAIRRATGRDPRPWFRCPFGSGADDQAIVDALAKLDYRHVGWHVEAFEWRPRASAKGVAERIVNGVLEHGDGAIVLLHPWPTPVAAALPGVLARLRRAGAQLARLDELDLPPGLAPIAFPQPAARR